MKKNNSIWPCEKQELLLKAAFNPPKQANRYFKEWHTKFSLTDLDKQTRPILPMLLQRLQGLEEFDKNSHLIKRYLRYYQITWLDNLLKFDQFRLLLELLKKEDIEICLLKGAAMVLHYYKNMGMRPAFCDIDILIKKNDLAKAIRFFQKQGFKPKHYHYWKGNAFEEKLLKGGNVLHFAHAITYVKGPLEIDLHWKDMQQIFHNSMDVPYFGINQIQVYNIPVHVLSPESQLLHLCVHGMNQSSEGAQLWWLIDALYLLQEYQDQFDWNRYFSLAQKNHFLSTVQAFFGFVNKINPSLIQPKAITKLKESKIGWLDRLGYQFNKRNVLQSKKIYIYMSVFLNSQKHLPVLMRFFYFRRFFYDFLGLAKNKSILLFVIQKIFQKSYQKLQKG